MRAKILWRKATVCIGWSIIFIRRGLCAATIVRETTYRPSLISAGCSVWGVPRFAPPFRCWRRRGICVRRTAGRHWSVIRLGRGSGSRMPRNILWPGRMVLRSSAMPAGCCWYLFGKRGRGTGTGHGGKPWNGKSARLRRTDSRPR